MRIITRACGEEGYDIALTNPVGVCKYVVLTSLRSCSYRVSRPCSVGAVGSVQIVRSVIPLACSPSLRLRCFPNSPVVPWIACSALRCLRIIKSVRLASCRFNLAKASGCIFCCLPILVNAAV